MASGLFFDPLRLLRIAPLIGSTGSLVHAIAELSNNSAFVDPRIRKQSDAILPTWYNTVFRREVIVVILLNSISTTTAIANIITDKHPGLHTTLYYLGLATAIGHMLFVPKVAIPIRDMVEERGEDGATSQMEKWLDVHRVRMAVADIPAWLSFLGAVLTVPL